MKCRLAGEASRSPIPDHLCMVEFPDPDPSLCRCRGLKTESGLLTAMKNPAGHDPRRQVSGQGGGRSIGRDREDDSIHLSLESDGRIGFFMENGRHDVLLTSEETLHENRWHHLVASWSSSTVDVFLDGRRVAWLREPLGLASDILPDFRVGGGHSQTESLPIHRPHRRSRRLEPFAHARRNRTTVPLGEG